MNRRDFLRLTGLSAIGVSFGSVAWPTASAETVASASGDPMARRIAALGAEYLRRHPSEADKTRLLEQLPGVDPRRPLLEQFSTLQSRFVEDFTAGRVVGVDGWVLALTEARAAAALALGA